MLTFGVQEFEEALVSLTAGKDRCHHFWLLSILLAKSLFRPVFFRESQPQHSLKGAKRDSFLSQQEKARSATCAVLSGMHVAVVGSLPGSRKLGVVGGGSRMPFFLAERE